MIANLALHEADVILDVEHPDQIVESVGVAVRRGVAKVIGPANVVVAEMLAASIDEVEHQRVYRVSGPNGTWLIRRAGGCGCGSSWPNVTDA